MISPALHAAGVPLDPEIGEGDPAVLRHQERFLPGGRHPLGIAGPPVAGMALHRLPVGEVGRHRLPLSRVVMQGADIGFHLLPAVVHADQPRAVQGLGRLIQHPRQRLLPPVGIDLRHAPALVQGHPGDDAGMVEIPCDEPAEGFKQIAGGISSEFIGAGDLSPHEQPHPVRPVIIPGILQLLMLPGAVVAQGKRHPDIRLYRLVAGRGEQGIRPVALVQHQPLIERGIVQVDPSLPDLNLPQAEIGAHPVQLLPAPAKPDFRVIELRPVRRPGEHGFQAAGAALVQIRRHREPPGTNLCPQAAHRPSRVGHRQLQLQRFRRIPVQGNVRRHLMPVEIRRQLNPLQGDVSHRLQPDRLPDPADRRIPAAHQSPVPVLLAPGLGAVRPVLRPDAQIVFPFPQEAGDIDRKRRIAAPVRAGQLAVHIHCRLEVHRAEVQQYPPALHFVRDLQVSPVPHHRMDFIRRSDAAELCLVGEGHVNAQIEGVSRPIPFFLPPRVPIVKRELPFSVQVHPAVPLKIRPRILRPRNRRLFHMIWSSLLFNSIIFGIIFPSFIPFILEHLFSHSVFSVSIDLLRTDFSISFRWLNHITCLKACQRFLNIL